MDESTPVTQQRRFPLWMSGMVAGIAVVAGIALVAGALLLRGAGSSTPTEARPSPTFVDESASAGIRHIYGGDFEFFVGGGVAVFDCDRDGRQDLFVAGGANPAGLYRNHSETGGSLDFAPIPGAETNLVDVIGAYPLDIDSDGHVDLAVLRLGENVLLRGLGDCRFERANELWNLDGRDDWTTGFTAKWEEDNTLPTLAFGNYLEWPVDRTKTATCADNQLFRPGGNSYDAPLTLTPGWCALSVLFTDWNRAGDVDLRVANDRHYYIDGSEQLWRVAPGEAPRLYTAEDGWEKIQIWGMGIATQDVTSDGVPEVYLTSLGDNKLQTLGDTTSRPTYSDIAIRRGVTAHRPFVGDDVLPSTGWHPEFQDVNNDGFVDLFVTKGNVEAMREYAMEDPNNLLLGQPDGTFIEGAVEAGVASLRRSRGGALVDFNLDGMLDLVVVNRTENVQLWRNVGEGTADEPKSPGNWLAVRLSQPGHNGDAIGARIEIEVGDHVIGREIAIGGGHAGDQLGWIHVGLGGSSDATVRVQWPGGAGSSEWTGLSANSFVILEPGQDPQYWDAP